MNLKIFEKRNKKFINSMSKDKKITDISKKWFLESIKNEYSYHFSWLGLPIIQYPQDIIALQEIIWKTKPDIIIETGIARGGSIIFSASLLELIGKGEVIGIDIKIRNENKKAIKNHPLNKRIHILEGSSTDKKILKVVKKIIGNKKKIMVVLDSNHIHKHVFEELKLYSTFVSKNGYLIVFDTIIDDLPKEALKNRPWGENNNPKSAVKEFLKINDRFRVDKSIEKKLLFTAAPMGYLKCVRNNHDD
jgi:cephalosporin hydroxylase